ncbi:MAG TPA: acyl-CoA dehydrogenase, partial [Kofleriaceae bacterium]|nr:acyl-CoA dehydrogenase [Kofleriaceae bacterium]
EAGARRFAMTLGRALELALLASHGQWCLANDRGMRAGAAARRFAAHGVDLLQSAIARADSAALSRGI